MGRLCELQTVRTGIVNNRAEWKNRIGSGLGDSIATSLAAATIEHFTAQKPSEGCHNSDWRNMLRQKLGLSLQLYSVEQPRCLGGNFVTVRYFCYHI